MDRKDIRVEAENQLDGFHGLGGCVRAVMLGTEWAYSDINFVSNTDKACCDWK